MAGKLQELWEAQLGATVLWAPVALTFGIWTYFALPQEPALPVTGFFLITAVLMFWKARGRMGMVLLAILLSGFVLAKFRTEMVATPLLKAATGEIVVSGVVHDVERASERRATIILEPDKIEGMTTAQLPRRLRLSNSRKNGEPAIGDRIAFKARLAPNASPTMPGGFDYGRQQYFEGIGGTGRMTSKIDTLGNTRSASLWLSGTLHNLRQDIGGRIRQHLQGTLAAFAEALITGERASIPKEVNKSLQISGLFHILSISGLHMSLAAGGVFWLVRALLALSPSIAQHWPIKKWAAAAALVFGFAYMLLAGSGTATQRSYIMLAVVFLAIIVDRPAISLRNLALAALLILILQPESAIQASFQMSFMAVMGLAAFFEYWNRPKPEQEYRIESRKIYYARKLYQIVLAAILTTLIAGSFSSIPAAYHFGRLAPYGVLANGLAFPVVGLFVMPFAVLSVVLMPLGLEAWPLAVLGKALETVLSISDHVAALPGAQRVIPQVPLVSAIALAFGASILCLASRQAKNAGLGLLLCGLVLAPFNSFPDLLIERTAANAAFRNGSGELVFASQRQGRFAAEKWLQANGEEVTFKQAAARAGWTCEARACRSEIKGKVIAYFRDGEGVQPTCAGLDIIIAAYPLRGACKSVPMRIDRFDVWRMGSHAIAIEGGTAAITTARGSSGNRPWVVVPEPRRKLAPAR
ncbi:MAG: ComEC family competence protein [Hyphomicrobiales bacterium]|nr:ComEC family competence protein [Hyphomicrobiales bacterium]